MCKWNISNETARRTSLQATSRTFVYWAMRVVWLQRAQLQPILTWAIVVDPSSFTACHSWHWAKVDNPTSNWTGKKWSYTTGGLSNGQLRIHTPPWSFLTNHLWQNSKLFFRLHPLRRRLGPSIIIGIFTTNDSPTFQVICHWAGTIPCPYPGVTGICWGTCCSRPFIIKFP